MITPPRILRDQADRLTNRKFHFSPRQKDRETRILLVAEHVFAQNSFACVTFGNLALALAISPVTLRQHFVDLDQLLADILQRHLFALLKTLTGIAGAGKAQDAARRKAWFEATRGVMGGLTDAHKLLIRERHNLPEDLRENIDNAYYALGELLAPNYGREALALLDAESADLPVIEALLTAPLTKPAAPRDDSHASKLPACRKGGALRASLPGTPPVLQAGAKNSSLAEAYLTPPSSQASPLNSAVER
jgi:AcrR family transcriptional regulator